MPIPTKDEVIRASESIKESTAKIEEFAIRLATQGMHEEAKLIETAINDLKKSLARIKVCDDGKVRNVH